MLLCFACSARTDGAKARIPNPTDTSSAHESADPRLAQSHQTERQSLSSRLSVFVSSSRNRPFSFRPPERARPKKQQRGAGGPAADTASAFALAFGCRA